MSPTDQIRSDLLAIYDMLQRFQENVHGVAPDAAKAAEMSLRVSAKCLEKTIGEEDDEH